MSLPANMSLIPVRSLLLALPFLSIGCANPAPPRPPSLQLPEIVSDLTAERIGDEVRLNWTTPGRTTDNLKIKGQIVAEICRSTAPSTVCLPVQRQRTQPGASEIVDRLPLALTVEPQVLISYEVRLLNDHERSAGFSSPIFAAAGSAPPAVADLHVTSTEPGALVQWKAEDAADSIELTRLHAVNLQPASRAKGKSSSQSSTKEPAELHLRAGRSGTGEALFRTDAGGTVDGTAHRGETYSYMGQRVRNVILGGHQLAIRSAQSTTVSVTMRDSFPPQPPAGLETIASQQTGDSFAIDLSWRPNREADLAGYLVYRQELAADGTPIGARLRLTSVFVQEPAYRDVAVTAGHTYSYTVTALDGSGNESGPGTASREELHLP